MLRRELVEWSGHARLLGLALSIQDDAKRMPCSRALDITQPCSATPCLGAGVSFCPLGSARKGYGFARQFTLPVSPMSAHPPVPTPCSLHHATCAALHRLLEIRHGHLKAAKQPAHIDEFVGIVDQITGELSDGQASSAVSS